MQLIARRSLYRSLADRHNLFERLSGGPLPRFATSRVTGAPGQQFLGHGFSVLPQFSIHPAVKVESIKKRQKE